MEETSALSNTLKRRIKALERQGGAGRDRQVKAQQVRGIADCTPGSEGLIHQIAWPRHWFTLIFRRGWSSPNSWRRFRATRR